MSNPKKISLQLRQELYAHIALLNESGVSVVECCERFARGLIERNQPRQAVVIKRLVNHLKEGGTLDDGLNAFITPTEAMMISAASLSGNFSKGLNKLLLVLERNQQLRVKFTEALAQCLFNLVVTVATFVVVAVSVVPSLAVIVPAKAVHGTVAVLFGLSAFSTSLAAKLLLAILVLTAVAFIRSLARWNSPVRLSLERLGPYAWYRDTQGLAWISTIASMVGTGIRERQALEESLRFATPWMSTRIRVILKNLNEGMTLPVAMAKATLYGKAIRFPSPDIVAGIDAIHGRVDFDFQVEKIVAGTGDKTSKKILRSIGFINTGSTVVLMGVMLLVMLATNDLSSAISSVH